MSLESMDRAIESDHHHARTLTHSRNVLEWRTLLDQPRGRQDKILMVDVGFVVYQEVDLVLVVPDVVLLLTSLPE